MRGILGGSLDWMTDPGDDESTLIQWGTGLLAILVLSFIWATVVNKVIAS